MLTPVFCLLLGMPILTQAQEERYIEVIGTAHRSVIPNEITYSVGINTEKFYDEYEMDYDYDQFDPVKSQEIENKVELRVNSARKQLMEIFEKIGVKGQEAPTNPYNLVNQDVYNTEALLLKVADFETLDRLVDELRVYDHFQAWIVRMDHSDQEKILVELKQEALKKAKAKAQDMAKVLEATIGQVLQIREMAEPQPGETYLNNGYNEGLDYYNNRRIPAPVANPTAIELQTQIWVRFALN